MHTRLIRRATQLLPTPRATPLTFYYLSGLTVSSWVLRTSSRPFAHRLTGAVSTDMAHLRSDPLTVLTASALLADQPWLSCAALFCISLAPLERRVGPARTAIVFAAGHVIATLATELPLGAAIAFGWLPQAAQHRLDFGVSYGMYACAGALVVLLPITWRRRALTAAALSTVLAAIANRQDLVACAGHPVALLVGVACGRILNAHTGPPPGRRASPEDSISGITINRRSPLS
jgi:hypothetical protein